MIPSVGRYGVRDMHGVMRYRHTVANIEFENDHTIASVTVLNGVKVSTSLLEPALNGVVATVQVKAIALTFTNCVADESFVGLVIVYAEYVDAVVFDSGLQGVCVENGAICQRGGVYLLISCGPYMRQRCVERSADICRVAKNMCLMNSET
jgi:hypothetical protein